MKQLKLGLEVTNRIVGIWISSAALLFGTIPVWAGDVQETKAPAIVRAQDYEKEFETLFGKKLPLLPLQRILGASTIGDLVTVFGNYGLKTIVFATEQEGKKSWTRDDLKSHPEVEWIKADHPFLKRVGQSMDERFKMDSNTPPEKKFTLQGVYISANQVSSVTPEERKELGIVGRDSIVLAEGTFLNALRHEFIHFLFSKAREAKGDVHDWLQGDDAKVTDKKIENYYQKTQDALKALDEKFTIEGVENCMLLVSTYADFRFAQIQSFSLEEVTIEYLLQVYARRGVISRSPSEVFSSREYVAVNLSEAMEELKAIGEWIDANNAKLDEFENPFTHEFRVLMKNNAMKLERWMDDIARVKKAFLL